MVHVGIGYDVHPFVAGRPLILGGVTAHSAPQSGLDGHSDADALMHTPSAMPSSAPSARGDIGTFFPNTDPRWRGAASKVFLQEAARQVKFHNGTIINVDATIIAQQPKVMPHVAADEIQSGRGAWHQLYKKIGIKATTNEHLGFIGREGRHCRHGRGGRGFTPVTPCQKQKSVGNAETPDSSPFAMLRSARGQTMAFLPP